MMSSTAQHGYPDEEVPCCWYGEPDWCKTGCNCSKTDCSCCPEEITEFFGGMAQCIGCILMLAGILCPFFAVIAPIGIYYGNRKMQRADNWIDSLVPEYCTVLDRNKRECGGKCNPVTLCDLLCGNDLLFSEHEQTYIFEQVLVHSLFPDV